MYGLRFNIDAMAEVTDFNFSTENNMYRSKLGEFP